LSFLEFTELAFEFVDLGIDFKRFGVHLDEFVDGDFFVVRHRKSPFEKYTNGSRAVFSIVY
jgi:hypothetical protein